MEDRKYSTVSLQAFDSCACPMASSKLSSVSFTFFILVCLELVPQTDRVSVAVVGSLDRYTAIAYGVSAGSLRLIVC
jgi:hypothetical protein